MIATLLLAAAEPEWNCKDPQDQSTMNMCAHFDFQRADADMNAQWRLTVAALREADQSVDRKYDQQPLHYDTLLAAQRAWLAYRDKHCEGASFEARGGSMQPMLASGCKAQLTRARTKELKELAGEER